MPKRLVRGFILGAAAMLVLAMGTAHADVTVDISTPSGSTVYSLPALPDGVDYPSELPTRITGTSSFDSAAEASVLYLITTTGEDVIQIGAGQADLNAEGTAWSFRVPFLIAPGNYHVTVTASQPDPSDPELMITATDTVDLQVL